MKMHGSKFERNIKYISALSRYNTERRQVLMSFFDENLDQENLYEETISRETISTFAENGLDMSKSEYESLEPEQRIDEKEVMDRFILTMPGSIPHSDFFNYLLDRYSPIDDRAKAELGFHIGLMINWEDFLTEIIEQREISKGTFQEIHKFTTSEGYFDRGFLEVPNKEFMKRWWECITFRKEDMIEYFSETSTLEEDVYSELEELNAGVPDLAEVLPTQKEIKSEIELVLDRYSLDLSNNRDYKDHQLLLTPYIPLKNSKYDFAVPFPDTLVTTLHFRIENAITKNDNLRSTEDSEKGDIVENSTAQLLQNIPCKNFVEDLHYVHDPKQGQMDGLLLYEDSCWVVEIKSHPIFRKIPTNAELVKTKFIDKVEKGIQQGHRGLDFLFSKETDLIYNLTANKNPDRMHKGILVVLDGFIPVMLSQNGMFDAGLGTDELYNDIPEEYRIYTISSVDLFVLLQQPEIESFEDFLIWRTDHRNEFPIVSYDEREYWAFYFDNYLREEKRREAFELSIEKEITTFYISERFNQKNHLTKDLKEDMSLN
jgi:hypothetical protein